MQLSARHIADERFTRDSRAWQSNSNAYGALVSLGGNTILAGALLCSMYGVYMDPSLHLPVVNYVPGWAYVVSNIQTPILIVGAILIQNLRGHFQFVLAMGLLALAVYLLFWITIPLLGYTYFFSWNFIADVVDQVSSTAIDCSWLLLIASDCRWLSLITVRIIFMIRIAANDHH